MSRWSLDNAISSKVYCPACLAPPGSPCSAPTETGRRDVKWFHFSRTSRAARYVLHAADVFEDSSGIGFQCTCGEGAVVSKRATTPKAKERARDRASEKCEAHLEGLRNGSSDY